MVTYQRRGPLVSLTGIRWPGRWVARQPGRQVRRTCLTPDTVAGLVSRQSGYEVLSIVRLAPLFLQEVGATVATGGRCRCFYRGMPP